MIAPAVQSSKVPVWRLLLLNHHERPERANLLGSFSRGGPLVSFAKTFTR